MANIRLIFKDCSNTGEYEPILECFLNIKNQITIRVEDSKNTDDFQVISFDKSTAIRFAKTLRTEINKIQE